MNKTLALLLDSYRELNSKKLFWITLIISGLVVVGMGCIGVNQAGTSFTLAGWDTGLSAGPIGTSPALLYKLLFSFVGVGFWLSFIGSILGLVSTAGIFPDFMAGGSIDLYLSKPISRLRLFLTKYIGGLLFVTLQISVFAIASFLLLGIRGHTWEPAVFLSIPLVVIMFSYLFSICVLLGVMTRSTIAALLLTVLCWFIVWGLQKAQTFVGIGQVVADFRQMKEDDDLARFEKQLPSMPADNSVVPQKRQDFEDTGGFRSYEPDPNTRAEMEQRIASLKAAKAARTKTLDNVALVIKCVLAPLPKTTNTTDLLDRELIKKADLPATDDKTDPSDPTADSGSDDDAKPVSEFARRRRDIVRNRLKAPAGYILGTSLGFEAVIMALAAWRFCSRDY
jgi:hypothetical protein